MEDKTDKQKNTWGGRRKGAGRPSKDNVKTFAFRMPADVAEILDKQTHRTNFVLDAIRAYDKAQRKKTTSQADVFHSKES